MVAVCYNLMLKEVFMDACDLRGSLNDIYFPNLHGTSNYLYPFFF